MTVVADDNPHVLRMHKKGAFPWNAREEQDAVEHVCPSDCPAIADSAHGGRNITSIL